MTIAPGDPEVGMFAAAPGADTLRARLLMVTGVIGAAAWPSNLEEPGGVLPGLQACALPAPVGQPAEAPTTFGRSRRGESDGERPIWPADTACVMGRGCGTKLGLVPGLTTSPLFDRRDWSMPSRTAGSLASRAWAPWARLLPASARACSQKPISVRTSSSSLSKDLFCLSSCSLSASLSVCSWARDAARCAVCSRWLLFAVREASRASTAWARSRCASIASSRCFSADSFAAASAASESLRRLSAAPARASAAFSRCCSAWSSWFESLFSRCSGLRVCSASASFFL
mmetsp:Transcript_60633/g.195339  ORF Transcript_60633/g.195339 Transcript_60633/m.195339 type:complete len:287 (-) Transcript_60633:952-1812(-)